MKSQETLRKEFEEGAFPYLDSLWRTSLWLTKSEDKASRLVQQTFVSAYKEWENSEPNSDYRSLLLKALSRAFIQTNNDKIRMVKLNPDEAAAIDFGDSDFSALKVIPCNALGKVFAGLSPEARLLVILSVCWRFSYDKIAELTSIEIHEVRAKMQIGRLKLRALLADSLIKSENSDHQAIASGK